jgi:hypothetical protein
MSNAYKILDRKPQPKIHTRDLGINGHTISKSDVKARATMNSFRAGSSNGIL